MGEEDEIMEELHALDNELKSFPAEAHWFCPRRQDEDPVDYDNPDEPEDDIDSETKLQLIKDAKRRHKVAYKYAVILGLAPEISGQLLEDYTRRLNKLLTTCDKCVHNWHMGRKPYLKDLTEQFDDDTVAELSNRLNALDFKRLDSGLEKGKQILVAAEPAKRTQSLLAQHDSAALLALYEALCCVDYHKSNERLAVHFDFVFEQVQNRKLLRIGDTLPAMARFLFDGDVYRLRFATSAWEKMSSELTPETFDWVVHDILSEAILFVAQPGASPIIIQRFWAGFLLILDKMDASLITHSLRAMEVQPDIYHLALQHLAIRCEGSNEIVSLVIEALRRLLKKAPKDFWSALGTISPATTAEQIFLSPGFEKLLEKSGEHDSTELSPTLAWIPELIESLDAAHRFDACRSLLYHLLERLQGGKFPESARLACCRAGLDALRATLDIFVSLTYTVNPSTSLLIINDIMGLVAHYKGMIVGCADLDCTGGGHLELKKLGMIVIRDALALDCKALLAEFQALENKTPIQRGLKSHSGPIWEAVLEIFRPGNVPLAKYILAATTSLTGLDEIRPADKKNPIMPEDHIHFNKDFKQLMDNISRVFERLSDFSSTELLGMYQDSQTARPLFAALVSADQAIYEAAVEVIKATTGSSGKQEAIETLLAQAFTQMLNSLTFAVNRIAKTKTFGPVPHMIKNGGEVLKALCGSTGILRTKSALTSSEQRAVMTWWTSQWRALDIVFSTTESWVPRVDKTTAYMQDFCRDAMEYAEALFDQHTVLASALRESSLSGDDTVKPASTKAALTKVLDIICQNVNGLTMMLRLRDTYLVSVITSLLGKLLRCLGEYGLSIDEFASEYIKDACKRESEKGFKRTNLTNQQKAELQKALDEHEGVEVIEVPPPITIKKQSTIDAWSKSADGRVHEPKAPIKNQSHNLSMASDKQKHVLERMKAAKEAEQARQNVSAEKFREARRQAEAETKRKKADAIAKAQALRGPSSIVRGEGSGIKSIGGVVGKDHAPVRSEIMVGSSDEDSDDDDVDETGALIKTSRAANQKVSEYEESRRLARLKQLQQGPVKKTKIQRSAKDLRARVEPNMDRLYQEILSWDLFHEGEDPPSNNECRRIDNKYLDLDLYKRTFGPLLISEVWRILATAREENTFKAVEIKVLNRLSVDKFMEVSTNIPFAGNKDKFTERDIVLLSQSSDPMNNKKEPHCLARVDRTTKKKDVIEITYRVSRDLSPALLQSLVPNGKIFGVKITDMTTTQREYAALSSLEYYDLCNEVLEAKPSPLQKYSDEKTGQMVKQYNLNKAQAKAVLSANDNDGFTLIQGPPGSGKTKTIVAMVGSLLTPSLMQQAEPARARPQGQGQAPHPSTAPKKKLLICAPSNAAVDELVVRLKEGVQPLHGPRQKISVIRIGRSDAISASVKDVMLDELVMRKLQGDTGENNKLLQDREKLHKDAGKIKERLAELRPQMDEARKNTDKALELKLQREFDGLKRSQAQIGAKIDEDKESGNTVSRQQEINRRRFQQEIIDGAHVLCATLSGSGHDMFRNLNVEFETVIIDEAAQCIELAALIPLKYGCSKCVLVGDPNQLPPTVFSRMAQSFGYEQSLFVRMQKNHPNDVHLLDTQYRMHPEISVFPSQQFYESRLIDGEGMAKLREKPWHASSILGPYRFFDVEGSQTKEARGHSFINNPEINAAIKLYERLKTDYKSYDFTGKIGIITTYKAQLNELRNRFLSKFGDAIFDQIEFNTTDAFQGREREIIIFSCVRAKASGGIGFLNDIRRMNVGLTRAKSSLWVLGDSRALQQGQYWNNLIENARSRGRYTGGDVLALLSKPTLRDRKTGESGAKMNGSGAALPVKSHMARIKAEDSDFDMVDAPSTSSSRKSSVDDGSVSSAQANQRVKQENKLPALGNGRPASPAMSANMHGSNLAAAAVLPVNSHGKRPREELAVKEEKPAKKISTTPTPQFDPPAPTKDNLPVDLDAALRAQQAAAKPRPSASTSRPLGVLGVAPPRRKAPADPFIQRKPPKKK